MGQKATIKGKVITIPPNPQWLHGPTWPVQQLYVWVRTTISHSYDALRKRLLLGSRTNNQAPRLDWSFRKKRGDTALCSYLYFCFVFFTFFPNHCTLGGLIRSAKFREKRIYPNMVTLTSQWQPRFSSADMCQFLTIRQENFSSTAFCNLLVWLTQV